MKKYINDIKRNYINMEKEMVTQLNYDVGNHYLTAGTNRENIWVDFFRRIVPKKFNIDRSVFIIDSKGNCSKEVDIAIYDEQYTPYIFNYGSIKFIPIEAVSAVIQCKSKKFTCYELLEWSESIDILETSPNSIARLAKYIHIGEGNNSGMQTATKPIKILCFIKDKEDKKDKDNYNFDIIIKACDYNGDQKLDIKFNDDDDFLRILRKYNQSDKEYSFCKYDSSELDEIKCEIKNSLDCVKEKLNENNFFDDKTSILENTKPISYKEIKDIKLYIRMIMEKINNELKNNESCKYKNKFLISLSKLKELECRLIYEEESKIYNSKDNEDISNNKNGKDNENNLNNEVRKDIKYYSEKKLKETKIKEFEIRENENKLTLLSFIFQFNQMLMIINNPMFFPHKAYVDMFNKNIK